MSESYSSKILLVADSHLPDSGSETEEFFRMLKKVESLNFSGIVFLGDIFELWIALPRYEGESHLRFVDWCRKKSKSLSVGFLEGNHEFFVAETHKKAFSWVWNHHFVRGGVLYLHGDTVNRRDWKYLLLRRSVRNRLTRALLNVFSGSIGPNVAQRVRLCLKTSNMEHKKFFPEEEMVKFASKKRPGVSRIVAGHFHEEQELEGENGSLSVTILPAWQNSGLVGVMDAAAPHEMEIKHWSRL